MEVLSNEATNWQPVVVREFLPAIDEAYLYSTWLKNFRSDQTVRALAPSQYYARYHRYIEKLIELPGTRVLFACPRSEPKFIYGWICTTEMTVKVLHYIYVKDLYRKHGVGRLLATAAGINEQSELVYTFAPRGHDKLAKKVTRAEYMPVKEFLG